MNRNLQIGIMGSAADLKYSKEAEEFAKELGLLIAKKGYTLVYGAEKDCCSLSTLSAKSCRDNGGLIIGITYSKSKEVWGGEGYMPSVIIPCGLERGGGREFTLVLSCDVIIAIGGGSGTLNEIAVAYQAGIPIVVADKFEGWSKKLSNKYLDKRKRLKCNGNITTPIQALAEAERLVGGKM